MNLDLGVLWIEDAFSEEEEANLRRKILDCGFVARIDVRPNGAGIEELAREHLLYHLYDIILLDWRLRDDHGDELAPRVRELFPSTTILFYSGSDNEEGLRTKIANKRVDGVYCSARGRFIERAGTLVEQTARSLDRLSGMRGLSMRVVADCDEMMKAAVLSMTSRDPACEAAVSSLDEDVLTFLSQSTEKYERSRESGLLGRLETRAVDSAKLSSHFRRLTKIALQNAPSFGLEAADVDEVRALRRATSQYEKDVLGNRNILGHVQEVRSDDGWVLQGSREIRPADFPDIRRTFAAYVDAFRRMIDLLTRLDGK